MNNTLNTSVEPRPRSRGNGLGLAGFITSLLGLLLTAGILCPLGLLLSLAGMFKAPRGFAVAGVIIGVMGSLIPLTGAWMAVKAYDSYQHHRQTVQTESKAEQAVAEIEQYRLSNGRLPEMIEGNKLVIDLEDAWGHPLRYEVEADQYIIRSAGPDGQFETEDDLKEGPGKVVIEY